MAKILISALGTGISRQEENERKYMPAVYRFSGTGKEYKTSFVAAALCEHLKVDRLYLVGTPKSMWEEVYRYYTEAANLQEDRKYKNLLADKAKSFNVKDADGNKDRINEEDLGKLNLTIDFYLKSIRKSATGASKCFVIEYGLNETELWNNFNTLLRISDMLEEDDEVYLDITHAFRSIALFNYITLDLIGILKFKKAFKLSGLYYGMLDIKGELEYAPIVDLSPYFNMTLWARAAYNFINFGNGYLLADLIHNRDLSENIRKISEIVNINYIDDFRENIKALNRLLENSPHAEPVIRHMFPYLSDFAKRFKGIKTNGELQFALAEWYFENKRYAQGYICLAESIRTRLLELYQDRGETVNWDENDRKKIKYLITKYLKENPEYCKISLEYKIINGIRNTIAHAGYSGNKSLDRDIRKAIDHVNELKKCLFNNPKIEKIPDEYPFNMLRTK